MDEVKTEPKYRTISVKMATYNRIRGYGQFGDTVDTLMKRILDKAEGKQ
jgi:hypothetical protein